MLTLKGGTELASAFSPDGYHLATNGSVGANVVYDAVRLPEKP